MADACDHAADNAAASIQDALAAFRSRQTLAASRSHCLECGEPIPAARQQATPGCQLCLSCQEEEEGGGFWP